jgi:hypothetical protein
MHSGRRIERSKLKFSNTKQLICYQHLVMTKIPETSETSIAFSANPN